MFCYQLSDQRFKNNKLILVVLKIGIWEGNTVTVWMPKVFSHILPHPDCLLDHMFLTRASCIRLFRFGNALILHTNLNVQLSVHFLGPDSSTFIRISKDSVTIENLSGFKQYFVILIYHQRLFSVSTFLLIFPLILFTKLFLLFRYVGLASLFTLKRL